MQWRQCLVTVLRPSKHDDRSDELCSYLWSIRSMSDLSIYDPYDVSLYSLSIWCLLVFMIHMMSPCIYDPYDDILVFMIHTIYPWCSLIALILTWSDIYDPHLYLWSIRYDDLLITIYHDAHLLPLTWSDILMIDSWCSHYSQLEVTSSWLIHGALIMVNLKWHIHD